MTLRNQVDSIPVPRNCLLEVARFTKAEETMSEGDAKVVETVGLVSMIHSSEENGFPLP